MTFFGAASPGLRLQIADLTRPIIRWYHGWGQYNAVYRPNQRASGQALALRRYRTSALAGGFNWSVRRARVTRRTPAELYRIPPSSRETGLPRVAGDVRSMLHRAELAGVGASGRDCRRAGISGL